MAFPARAWDQRPDGRTSIAFDRRDTCGSHAHVLSHTGHLDLPDTEPRARRGARWWKLRRAAAADLVRVGADARAAREMALWLSTTDHGRIRGCIRWRVPRSRIRRIPATRCLVSRIRHGTGQWDA